MRTRQPLSEAEILDSLRQCRGDVKAAAQFLGISDRTLYRRMAEFGIRSQISYHRLVPTHAGDLPGGDRAA